MKGTPYARRPALCLPPAGDGDLRAAKPHSAASGVACTYGAGRAWAPIAGRKLVFFFLRSTINIVLTLDNLCHRSFVYNLRYLTVTFIANYFFTTMHCDGSTLTVLKMYIPTAIVNLVYYQGARKLCKYAYVSVSAYEPIISVLPDFFRWCSSTTATSDLTLGV